MPTTAELSRQIELLRAELAEMKESLQMHSHLYESVKSRNEELARENKELRDENKQLGNRLAALEQYSRLNNVEIKGIPNTEGENCLAAVQAIGEKVGCPVEPKDTDVVHRVPAKNGSNIIARFCSRAKKAEFATKARKARITTGVIGFRKDTDRPVFVNDHLTPENKRLFAQALELKKAKNWKHLWTDSCVINARKSDDSRVFRIRETDHLSIFH